MSKKTRLIQVLIDEDTMAKLNRLILVDAFERGEKPKSNSGWLRELIEETVNFEPTAKKIEEYNPRKK